MKKERKFLTTAITHSMFRHVSTGEYSIKIIGRVPMEELHEGKVINCLNNLAVENYLEDLGYDLTDPEGTFENPKKPIKFQVLEGDIIYVVEDSNEGSLLHSYKEWKNLPEQARLILNKYVVVKQ